MPVDKISDHSLNPIVIKMKLTQADHTVDHTEETETDRSTMPYGQRAGVFLKMKAVEASTAWTKSPKH